MMLGTKCLQCERVCKCGFRVKLGLHRVVTKGATCSALAVTNLCAYRQTKLQAIPVEMAGL